MVDFASIDPGSQPSARKAQADDDARTGFIRNTIPTILHYIANMVQNALPVPTSVHVAPDFYIQVFKLRFNYDAITNALASGSTSTDISAIIQGIDIFQLNDLRNVTSAMSCGKNPGSAGFTLNQLLINDKLVETIDVHGQKFLTPRETLKNVKNPDVTIDYMDIVKVFIRNRFPDPTNGANNYSCTFTGFITSVTHIDQPKVDFAYQYGAHDISTALRLAPVPSQINLQQMVNGGPGYQQLQKNIYWNNPLVVNQSAIDTIKTLIDSSWWTYPNSAQVLTKTQPSDNAKVSRVQILNPSSLGLLNLNIFPANLPNIRAYGSVFNRNMNLAFYQQSDKLPYEVCKDLADVIGLEFYATPEGNLYFGIPKWDIDIDGSYYAIENSIITRTGFFDLNGTLSSIPSQSYVSEIDAYTINQEDVIGYEETGSVENIYTRVDVGFVSWDEDLLATLNPSVSQSVFKEKFFFSFPDIKFWDPSSMDNNSEFLREMTRYGVRPFPVSGKAFLQTDEAIKAYAQFVYDKLKGQRTQAKLTIVPRPEIRAGRTIRIPYKNLIAYVTSATNSVVPKKSASTTLQLSFIRSAEYDPEKSRFSFDGLTSIVEQKYGSFIPAGTFDFTALQEN